MHMDPKGVHVSAAALTDPVAKEQSDRKLLKKITEFLLAHRLDPAPANYLLAHQVLTRSNPAAVAAVENATSGGVRLSQKDADRIAKDTGVNLGTGERTATIAAQAVQEARRQLEAVERIVGSSHAHAERYGRDLQSTAADLNDLAFKESLDELLKITAQMVERTKEAEKQLQRTAEEVQALKRELGSAYEDARTDALTGLPNRRALEDRFDMMQQAGIPFSAAVADVDHFKAINDRHGHVVGDRVLRAVAQSLESSCSGHMVSRFGGEEFVVLLEHTGAESAAALLDVARCEIASRRFKLRETDDEIGTITLSAGVAEARGGETWLEMLMRADLLLCQAKAEGRNQVVAEEAPAGAEAG